MKREPLPKDPDNDQLGRAIREVEDCVHETGKRLSAEIARHRSSTDGRISKINTRLARMERVQAGVRQVVGVNDEGKVIRRSAMSWGRMEVIATLGGVVTVAVGAVQLFIHLLPAIELGGLAVWSWLFK